MPNGYRTPRSGDWRNSTNRDLTPREKLLRPKKKKENYREIIPDIPKPESETILLDLFNQGETLHSVSRETFKESDIRFTWKKFIKQSPKFKSRVIITLFLPLRDKEQLKRLLNEGKRKYSEEEFVDWSLSLFFYNVSNEMKMELAKYLSSEHDISFQVLRKYYPQYI